MQSLVKEYKEKVLLGQCLDLVPLSTEDSDKIVALRNKDKNRYNLNQDYVLTKENQDAWYQQYKDRTDDLYWCIFEKDGRFLGTIRLYEIDENNKTCRQGSFIIDDEYSKEGPYALEAIIRTLDLAFGTLALEKVYNDDRADNKVMNNLSKKFGFVFEKEILVKEVPYNLYSVTEEQYQKKREKIQALIDYWATR